MNRLNAYSPLVACGGGSDYGVCSSRAQSKTEFLMGVNNYFRTMFEVFKGEGFRMGDFSVFYTRGLVCGGKWRVL